MSHALPVDASHPQFARPAMLPGRARFRHWFTRLQSRVAARHSRDEATLMAAPSSSLRAELIGLGADRLLFALGVILALAMAGWLFGAILSPVQGPSPFVPQL